MAVTYKKRRLVVATPPQGGGAASYASFPAPAGFFWDFVTEAGSRITEANVPVVSLEKAA